jgi:hypothetical protein
LRVFASWPGDAKLDRTLPNQQQNRKKTQARARRGPSHSTGQAAQDEELSHDTDLHPLATLHLDNFNQTSKQLDINWFRGDVEQKEVVHLKRLPGREDSDMSRRRKRARLETWDKRREFI